MSTARLHIKSRNVYQLLRGDLTLPCALVAQSSHHAALSTLSNSIRYQTRSYATPKGARKPLRPPPRAPKLVKAQTNSSSQTDFDLSQISPMDFELAMLASENQVGSLRPDEYYEYASRFSNAIRKGAHPSSVNLSGKFPRRSIYGPTNNVQRSKSQSRLHMRWRAYCGCSGD